MPHPSKRLVSRASLLTQTSTPRLGTFKSGHNKLELSAAERRRSSVITPIGKIDKDNLNDLLADMSHLLLEEEVGSRILAQNLHYFSRNAKKSVDLTAETTNRRGSILLDTKKVTNTNFEALTMKLFPDANLKFNFRNKDKKSFKNYLNCLKSDRYD